MRFGIKALQREALIPPDLSIDQMSVHFGSFDYSQLVRSLAENGFKTIELGGDLTLFLPTVHQPKTIRSLTRLKDELDLTYTIHLPLWSVEPSTPLEQVRRGSVQALVEHIQQTLPLEPEVLVLHATGALAAEFYRMDLPELAKDFILKLFQVKARESLEWILEETGIPSRLLEIETIEFPFELTIELAEVLDLSICLDTGHVIVGFSGPITVDQALEASKMRLAEVHLHDGPWQGPERKIGYHQDHRPLGKGDLDVGCFFNQLEAVGFKGPIVFELEVHEALTSLEVIRELRPDLLIDWPGSLPG